MLPPETQCSLQVEQLADSVLSALQSYSFQPGLFHRILVRNIIRVVAPFGDICGINYPMPGQADCVAIYLAKLVGIKQNVPENDLHFLNALTAALGSELVAQHHKSINMRPSPDQNPIIGIHMDVCLSPCYELLAEDLQIGLIAMLERADWQNTPKSNKTIDAFLSPVRRILPLLPRDKFEVTLLEQDNEKTAKIIFDVITSLQHRSHSEQGLKPNTQLKYLRDFCLAINHPEWLKVIPTPGLITAGGTSGKENNQKQLFDEFDDPPEDLDKCKRTQITISKTAAELKLARQSDQSPHTYPEELAVQDSYLDAMMWRCAHPTEIVLALRFLSSKLSTDISIAPRQQLLPLAIFESMFLLGRDAVWLSTVHVGTVSANLNAPIYDRQQACIVLPAEYGDPASFRSDDFIPTGAYAIIPLPSALHTAWNALPAAPGQPLFPEAPTVLATTLKEINDHLCHLYPNIPRLTESRLRNAFTIMHHQYGELDPILSYYISGQLTNAISTPLYYSCVSSHELAKHFRPASSCVSQELDRAYLSLFGEHFSSFQVQAILPSIQQHVWMGSTYTPKVSIVRQMFMQALAYLNRSTGHERHNAITIIALLEMAYLAGFRISEVSTLLPTQVDLYAKWNGQPFPHIVLDWAKSSRFTTAARIVPLAKPLVKVWEYLLAEAQQVGPIYFKNTKGKIISFSAAEFQRQLEVGMVHLPRYHSGRHFLRTIALHRGVQFSTINLILGHQSAGHEALNPYIANDIWGRWQEYIALADRLANTLSLRDVKV